MRFPAAIKVRHTLSIGSSTPLLTSHSTTHSISTSHLLHLTISTSFTRWAVVHTAHCSYSCTRLQWLTALLAERGNEVGRTRTDKRHRHDDFTTHTSSPHTIIHAATDTASLQPLSSTRTYNHLHLTSRLVPHTTSISPLSYLTHSCSTPLNYHALTASQPSLPSPSLEYSVTHNHVCPAAATSEDGPHQRVGVVPTAVSRQATC